MVAARDAHLCERCNLIFEGDEREWDRGYLGDVSMRERRNGLTGILTREERMRGLRGVADVRRQLGDELGAQRCEGKIEQIKIGAL